MKKFIPINTDADGNAKTILACCYKFGFSALLNWEGSTMTCVGVVQDEETDRRNPNEEDTCL